MVCNYRREVYDRSKDTIYNRRLAEDARPIDHYTLVVIGPVSRYTVCNYRREVYDRSKDTIYNRRPSTANLPR